MILVLGSSADSVYPRLMAGFRESKAAFAFIDEDHPENYEVRIEQPNRRKFLFRIIGNGCTGKRLIGGIFVRHAVARTLDPEHLMQMGRLQSSLNQMLLSASCPIINPPHNSYSNYSKPYQLGLMVQAGFEVPRSLVTNIREEALRFYELNSRSVIFKGASNMMTLAKILKPKHFRRMSLLPNSPTLFQEYIAGVDYRVHVIADSVFVTRLVTKNEDYRRSAFIQNEEVIAEPARLPESTIQLCVDFTKQLGLVVSGIDFKQDSNGRLVALELNPFPQFTFYESRTGQPITRSIIDHLSRNQTKDSNVYA